MRKMCVVKPFELRVCLSLNLPILFLSIFMFFIEVFLVIVGLERLFSFNIVFKVLKFMS